MEMNVAGEADRVLPQEKIGLSTVDNLENFEPEIPSADSSFDEADVSCTHALDLTVTRVEKRVLCADGREIVLKDHWMFTEVAAGDPIRVLVPSYKCNRPSIEVTCSEGAVILAPEIILSASKISSAISCRRRFVLDSMFHFGESFGKAILIGNVAHKIFQTVAMLPELLPWFRLVLPVCPHLLLPNDFLGKTSTIVALVRLLLHCGKSVLIASHTNSAVDNVLSKLMQAVVAATCYTVSSHPLFLRRRFDVCIIDEATLVLESFCISALLCSEKFILVGDSLQLQPLVVSLRARKEGMAVSLFSRLERRYPTTMCKLQKQYRMNRVICSLSSAMFYEGQLKPGDPYTDSAVLEYDSPSVPYDQWLIRCLSLNINDSVIFVSTSRCSDASALRKNGSAIGNAFEATLVARLCDVFLKASGLRADQIGVVTTYRHQVDVVKKCLLTNLIQVNTIDQFQGKDKEVIVISFVWSRNVKTRDDSPCLLLEDENRLNVALTRAKKKLIMIGHLVDLVENIPVFSLLRKQLLDNQIVWMDDSMI
ncbi:Dna2 and AAA 12 and AAA 11 domain containing prot ein [Trichuris trichiura]|uniref:DNA replication ATP-dependent helicase/nuclease n=1 Tax=Trichuris trichiura TaxID=36087 RepID=A0A077Z7K8_TRITR|nr:Dna2 and AAA 12 and AAA 11 domain containing prot ein [Trichuris trichiura]